MKTTSLTSINNIVDNKNYDDRQGVDVDSFKGDVWVVCMDRLIGYLVYGLRYCLHTPPFNHGTWVF